MDYAKETRCKRVKVKEELKARKRFTTLQRFLILYMVALLRLRSPPSLPHPSPDLLSKRHQRLQPSAVAYV